MKTFFKIILVTILIIFLMLFVFVILLPKYKAFQLKQQFQHNEAKINNLYQEFTHLSQQTPIWGYDTENHAGKNLFRYGITSSDYFLLEKVPPTYGAFKGLLEKVVQNSKVIKLDRVLIDENAFYIVVSYGGTLGGDWGYLKILAPSKFDKTLYHRLIPLKDGWYLYSD